MPDPKMTQLTLTGGTTTRTYNVSPDIAARVQSEMKSGKLTPENAEKELDSMEALGFKGVKLASSVTHRHDGTTIEKDYLNGTAVLTYKDHGNQITRTYEVSDRNILRSLGDEKDEQKRLHMELTGKGLAMEFDVTTKLGFGSKLHSSVTRKPDGTTESEYTGPAVVTTAPNGSTKETVFVGGIIPTTVEYGARTTPEKKPEQLASGPKRYEGLNKITPQQSGTATQAPQKPRASGMTP